MSEFDNRLLNAFVVAKILILWYSFNLKYEYKYKIYLVSRLIVIGFSWQLYCLLVMYKYDRCLNWDSPTLIIYYTIFVRKLSGAKRCREMQYSFMYTTWVPIYLLPDHFDFADIELINRVHDQVTILCEKVVNENTHF